MTRSSGGRQRMTSRSVAEISEFNERYGDDYDQLVNRFVPYMFELPDGTIASAEIVVTREGSEFDARVRFVNVQSIDGKPRPEMNNVGGIEFGIDPNTRQFYLELFENRLETTAKSQYGARHWTTERVRALSPYLKGMMAVLLAQVVGKAVDAGLVDMASEMKLTALPLKQASPTLDDFRRLVSFYHNTMAFELVFSEHDMQLSEQVEWVMKERNTLAHVDDKYGYEREFALGIPMRTTVRDFLRTVELKKSSKRVRNLDALADWHFATQHAAAMMGQPRTQEETLVKWEKVEEIAHTTHDARRLTDRVSEYVHWYAENAPSHEPIDRQSLYDRIVSNIGADKPSRERVRRLEWEFTPSADFTEVDAEPEVDPEDRPLEDTDTETEVLKLDEPDEDFEPISESDDDPDLRTVATIPPPSFSVDDDNDDDPSSSSSNNHGPNPAYSGPNSPIFSSATHESGIKKRRIVLDLTDDDPTTIKKLKW